MSKKVSKPKKSSAKVASAKISTKSIKGTEVSVKRTASIIPFKRIHLASLILYVLLAVAALLFMKDISYQTSLGYLAKDSLLSAKTGTPAFGPAAHAVYDLQLRYAVAAVMLLSAILPLLYLTRLKDTYRTALANRVSKWRWIDMGITMGLIIEVVALLSGLSDIPTLKIIGLMILLTCLLGWLAEKQANGKRLPSAYNVSLITGTLPWLIIVPYALATVIYGSLVAPWYVYALYVTTFVTVSGLTINQYRQHRQVGKWQNYNYAERKYLTFNMFGKVAFALILILGLLK